MGESLKAHYLRQLMRTAQELRHAAESTNDAHYIGMFLRAAVAVELRATEIANAPGDLPPDSESLTVDKALENAPEHVDLIV